MSDDAKASPDNVLIIGATSAIAEAAARLFAERGCKLHLLARDSERLAAITADLQLRGAASVASESWEASRFEDHPRLIDAAFAALGRIDIALLAHGTLPQQADCAADFTAALRELNTNAIGAVSMLTHLANRFEEQGGGTLAVITSVAGDRGRQSNYLYGAAKSMVSTFLQGLRQRLHKSGAHVLDIKPGFVDTPMTAAFEKGILWADPERVARGILRAIAKKKPVAYLPGFWRFIMLIIKHIPEPIFKRLNL